MVGSERSGSFTDQDPHHVGVFLEIAISRAVTYRADAHGRHGAEILGEGRDYGCAGGSGEFEGGSTGINGFVFEKRRGGRGGDGKHAVLRVDGAAAHVDGRTMDGFDAEQIEGEADADDVADGIDRAHFVEMHLFDIDAVDGGFGFAQHAEDALGFGFYGSGEIGGMDHLQDSARDGDASAVRSHRHGI